MRRHNSRTIWFAVIASAISLACLIQAAAASATVPAVSPATANAAAGDEIVTGVGDTAGYHLYAASSGTGWAWRPLVTLQPGGYSDERWIGRQCLTGDGRDIAVVVAPWHAANTAAGMDTGGYGYLVDARDGSARPLAAGLSLAYFDPGCGASGQVVLTRFTRADEGATQLLSVDTRTGAVRAPAPVSGELTSAVPVGGAIVAARGNRLVRLTGTAAASMQRVIATLPGTPFDLRPASNGGLQLLVRENARTAGWWQVSPAGHAVRLGSGPLVSAALFAGRGGRVFPVGLRAFASARSLGAAPSLHVPAGLPDTVSLDGTVLLQGTPRSGRAPKDQRDTVGDTELRATGSGAVLASAVPPPGPGTTRSVPAYVGAPVAVARRGITPDLTATQSPACAVPRLSPSLQVPQPDARQVDWAAQQAARGLLTATRLDSQWGLPATAPSSDFPLPAPFNSGNPVPREVVEAVMAQESNWWQASWHALPGIPGDPLIADYYGYNSSGTIDYSQADCGYGLGQITSIMQAGSTDPYTGAAVPPAVQDKVAMDYAENAAATTYFLAHKWNELVAAGITPNNSDPEKLENWYTVAWDYNTGLHPNTGSGPWGLGWANNPINPVYPANRPPFLEDTYGDASHPGDWPYQERVFGWMAVPLGGNAPDYEPSSRYPLLPAESAFCDSGNQCDPSDPANGFCERSDYECWWHQPVTWVSDCATSCTSTIFRLPLNAPEPPAPNDPHPPVCNSTLPSSAIIVNDQPTDQNLVGCSGVNWHNSGTFAVNYGTDGAGNPVGEVDWHQLGAGFGGHFWFTHTRQAGELTADTGTWTPSGLTAGRTYNIKVFIPDTGAAAAQAVYTVNPGSGHAVQQRTIDQFTVSDAWVGLGDFTLYAGATLRLSSVTPDADGYDDTDIAFSAAAFIPVSGTVVHHTVDTATIFQNTQNLDSSLNGIIASNLVSNQSIQSWGQAQTETAATLPICSGSTQNANCLPSDVASVFTNWAKSLSEPPGQWLGLSNPPPPNPLTAGWLSDPTHYKTLTHLDVDYMVRSDGTIDPGSIDVTGYNETGNTTLAPFILPLMNAVANDYGIPAPDLTYTAPNLNSYNDLSTTVNLNQTGQAPGRIYMPWIQPAALDSTGKCVSLAAIVGASDGYVSLLNDSSVNTAVENWLSAIVQGYDAGTIPGVIEVTATDIVNEFFHPVSSNIITLLSDLGSTEHLPVQVNGSILTFSPAIWAETHLKLCTGSSLVQPDGGVDANGVQTIADNSYMPDLYVYVDGSLHGANGTTATGPISTGDWKDFSNLPVINNNTPWNSCYIGPGGAAHVFIARRDGNPFDLNFLTAPGEVGNSVFLCDQPDNIHYDNGQP